MRFNVSGHLLLEAKQCASPNFSNRAEESSIDLLVIHNISLPPGQFENGCINEFFCNRLDHGAHPFFDELKDLKVSAHLLISRSGTITQFVPFDKKAWHAGDSCFEGREACNDFSIGIEMEGTDYEAFTDIQYEVLAEVTNSLIECYPQLKGDRIVGHSDIAPGRKTDPGPFFDWEKYRGLIE